MPVTEKEAVAALPPGGWLRRYVIHGLKQTTAPLIYHLGVGITILGTTCPLAYGMHYAGQLRANNFCLLVGRSGEDQKSSALAVGKEILDHAAAPLIGDFPGSPEGLIDSLARRPSQFIPISEFGKFLSAAQRGYFEPTKTLLADLWDCLDEHTEILGEDGWKKMGEVKRGSRVWSLDPETDELVLSRVLDVGTRPVRPGERMVELKGQQHDICTTEGHRYYTKYRDPGQGYKPSSRYVVRTGKQLASRRSSFYLPFSAAPAYPGVGVPLTDDELRFIAWFITDGSLSRGGRSKASTHYRLKIAQSEGKHADRIRHLLHRLGLDWTESSRHAGGFATPTSPPVTAFRIPKGTGKGSKKRRGWNKYRKWLDKDLAPALLQMSKRQFKVFWQELLLGDGEQTERGAKGLLWSVRKLLVDRLQHLAVTLGHATQYGTRPLPSGLTAYRLGVSSRRLVQTDPGHPRGMKPRLYTPAPGTLVWCATTEHGTLVTRRNGKVVIIGNSGPTQRTKANNKVIRVPNPRLSIGAACSIPYLEKHTLSEDWTGGFMGRWVVLYGKRERNDPDPIGDREDFAWLSEQVRARAVATSAGWCVGLSTAGKRYWADWYNEITNRKLPENIIGIRSRAPTMARKIALVYGWDFGPALAGEPWEMDLDVLVPAIALTELHVKSLVHLSEVIAEHSDARLRRSVIQAILLHRGVATLGEILGVMKCRKRPVVEALEALMEEGRVARDKTAAGYIYILHSTGWD